MHDAPDANSTGPAQASPGAGAGLSFVDLARFQLEGTLGAGGMGLVYRVFDRKRRRSVALKTLGRVGPAAIYELKGEFRALQGILHPGLITLHDLFATENNCYFTMELVNGKSFSRFFAPPQPDDPALWDDSRETAPSAAQQQTQGDPEKLDTLPARYTPRRTAQLRACLRKLAEALDALHRGGKLHRDIKPSNVLITPEERVVLLDFGLAQNLTEQDPSLSYRERLVAGTPAYMAPEQLAGHPASPASDWYSVGVMLFETISGHLPFNGSLEEIFTKKQTLDPPSVPLSGDGQHELAELCEQLLQRSPSRRPRSEQILQTLGATISPKRPAGAPDRSFVGRGRYLSALHAALAKATTGQPSLLLIRGAAGSGKTSLLRHFCGSVSANGSALVLWSRSHPRETMPFRALDSAVDELSRYLRRAEDAQHLLPRHTEALSQLFPVLGRVAAIQTAQKSRGQVASEVLRRHLAFDACAELLARVSDRLPLVLVIDDAQFGDRDSAELLTWIFSGPSPPAMLVVCAYDDEGKTSELVAAIPPDKLGAAERVDLELSGLSAEEAEEISRSLLRGSVPFSSGLARTLAQVSGGHPGTLVNLASYASEPNSENATSDNPTAQELARWLAHADSSSLEKLDQQQDSILQLLSLLFSPAPIEALAQAANLPRTTCQAALYHLVEVRLARVFATDEDDLYGCADERVRTSANKRVTEKRAAQAHAALGSSLLAYNDFASAGRHFKACGLLDRAAECFSRATDSALSSMALETALGFIEQALECQQEAAARVLLLLNQADCHERLGHPARAAEALAEAAALSPDSDSGALLKRAVLLEAEAGSFEELTSDRGGQYGLFDALPRSSIESIVAQSRIVHGNLGDRLTSTGVQASEFLFVLSGALELRHRLPSSQNQLLVSQAGKNELVGEVGFLLEARRQVDIFVAAPGTRVLCVSRESLDDLAVQQPRVALRLVLNLATIVCSKMVSLRERILLYNQDPPSS